MTCLVALMLVVSACTGSQDQSSATDQAEPTQQPTEPPGPDEPADTAPSVEPIDPEPYIPAGQPGTAAAYQDLIAELEADVPAELRSQVPWPDLRDPNPVEVQLDIFELWIWMEENHPNPRLAEIMSATGSPSRGEITSVFGGIDRRNEFHVRNGDGYVAFDHRIVTFASAGLPLWLARDVPDDAVVVYYTDQSGPITVIDQTSGQIVSSGDPVPARTWLSIMVPTNVGWQLWRDQLIEPNDAEFTVPDVPPPPGADEQQRTPEL